MDFFNSSILSKVNFLTIWSPGVSKLNKVKKDVVCLQVTVVKQSSACDFQRPTYKICLVYKFQDSKQTLRQIEHFVWITPNSSVMWHERLCNSKVVT